MASPTNKRPKQKETLEHYEFQGDFLEKQLSAQLYDKEHTLLPAGVRMRFTASVVPDELPAAIVGTRIFIIADPIALLTKANMRKIISLLLQNNQHRRCGGRRRMHTWFRNLLSLVAHPICMTPDVITVTS